VAHFRAGAYFRTMTLLSDIIRVLHAADVPSYSVHATTHDLPGNPDLVVTLTGNVDQEAAELLTAARIPIGALKWIAPGIIHIWEFDPPCVPAEGA
jgi:hypothetical protein